MSPARAAHWHRNSADNVNVDCTGLAARSLAGAVGYRLARESARGCRGGAWRARDRDAVAVRRWAHSGWLALARGADGGHDRVGVCGAQQPDGATVGRGGRQPGLGAGRHRLRALGRPARVSGRAGSQRCDRDDARPALSSPAGRCLRTADGVDRGDGSGVRAVPGARQFAVAGGGGAGLQQGHPPTASSSPDGRPQRGMRRTARPTPTSTPSSLATTRCSTSIART